MGRVSQELSEVFFTTSSSGRVTQEIAEVFFVTGSSGRVSQEISEVFFTTASSGRISQELAEVFISFAPASVNIGNIVGTVGSLATFTPTEAGAIAGRSWSWQTVPGGSSIANLSPPPLPDSSVTTWFPMTSNLALYHCENDSLDSSGNSNNITLSSVTYSPGKIGSYSFDFSSSTTSEALLGSTISGAGDYSACFWFYNLKPNSSWRTGLRTVSGAGEGHPIMVETGTNNLGVYSGGFVDSGFDMPSASYTGWHHIAIVADSTSNTTKFYVDGVYVGTAAAKVSGLIQSIGNLQSSLGGNQVFADRLDEISLWSRKLTAGEVQLIYRVQENGYAGYGSSFSFTPDVVGAYDVDFYYYDAIFDTTDVVAATATISAAPPPPPPPPPPQTGLIPVFSPDKSGYGVELRYGRDIKKRSNMFFISSGQWAEMPDDGLIDQGVPITVFGELIDALDITPFAEWDERRSPAAVLESDFIIRGQTIDYEDGTYKDGRITVFVPSARSYVSHEEVPYQSRGFKADDGTIVGYSVGQVYNPFPDGGASVLGISREGFYGMPPEVTMTFVDRTITDGLGFEIDYGDYDSEYQTGTHGTPLYSSEFGTDSIAYAGMKK
jgi:hypothetical protein